MNAALETKFKCISPCWKSLYLNHSRCSMEDGKQDPLPVVFSAVNCDPLCSSCIMDFHRIFPISGTEFFVFISAAVSCVNLLYHIYITNLLATIYFKLSRILLENVVIISRVQVTNYSSDI